METNNAEQVTDQIQAAVADTEGTTDAGAIEAGETATGEESSGVEGDEQSQIESDLVYDLDGEEVPVSAIREWKKGYMLQADYTKKTSS